MTKEIHQFIGVCQKCGSPVYLGDCSGATIVFDYLFVCPENSTLVYRTCKCDSRLIRRSYFYNKYIAPFTLRVCVCLMLLITIPELIAPVGIFLFIVMNDFSDYKINEIQGKDVIVNDHVEIEGGKTLFIGEVT